MKNIKELADIVLENETVPAAEVVTIVPQVRTNTIFPMPAWVTSGDEDHDAE